jgi:dTDP-4-dehydrorhamnose reductase
MRIAVTGAGGGVGRAFLSAAPSSHEVVPYTHDELDVSDLEGAWDRIAEVRPDVVLHLAAMTRVDACEEQPRRAFLVNAAGTFNVALAARRSGAAVVAVSTDYVFDGEKGEAYDERDMPNPVNEYGWSKLLGERAVEIAGPESLVVRTSWIFGSGDDFVSRSIRGLASGEEVGGIANRVGTPTYVEHLAERLVPLIESGLRGVVHLAGPEPTTWFDVLARARRLGALPGEPFEQKEEELDRPARRPANSALTSVVAPVPGVPPMPPLDQAIREVLDRVR